MVTFTLRKMAQGGMHDQLGGGFARYSTDTRWLVPHFEKMIYDNAQLARLYLRTFQVSGDEYFREVAEQTLDYVLREMRHEDGGFYSSQDADSEGEEGKFFVWSAAEVGAALGADAALFMRVYGLSKQGNWEGKNILHLEEPRAIIATLGLDPEEPAGAGPLPAKLFRLRSQRVWPGWMTSADRLEWPDAGRFAEADGCCNGQTPGRRDCQRGVLQRALRREDGRRYAPGADANTMPTWGPCPPAEGCSAYDASFDARWMTWGGEYEAYAEALRILWPAFTIIR
jgi:hypothetical protein